jgi:precorrin-6A/cobalt-precorrin-6A reductase
MHRYRIDVLVAKESGGALPGKIVAARTFGLPVLLIRRPPPEEGETAETVAEALTWLGRALIPSA